MNFKALALGSVITLGSIFASVAPASAGTCWFNNNRGSLSPNYCQTSSRVNYNGHTVWDIVDHKGTEMTVVFWVNKSGDSYGDVELIYNGRNVNGRWYYDRQGDRRITVGNQEMAIRF